MPCVDETECEHYVQQFQQQQQRYTDQVPAVRLPPDYHETIQYNSVTPGDNSYFGLAADLPSVPAFGVPMTTYRVAPVQGPSSGVHPQMSAIVNAPTAALQLAQHEPLVAAPAVQAVHVNSLLPGQVNAAPPVAVTTTPGTSLYILCVI